MFKKTIQALSVASLVFISQAALASNPKVISTYKDLYNSLSNGHNVRAIIDLSKCNAAASSTHKDISTLLVGMNFTRFIKYQKIVDGDVQPKIIAADSLVVDTPVAGVSVDYVQLTVSEDGAAEIVGEYINPLNSSPTNKETYDCHLSDGKDSNGIKLFESA